MATTKINLKSLSSHLKNLCLVLLTLAFCIAMIAAPEFSFSGAAKGIGYCLSILVPSLFPFMFMASFFVKSRILQKFEKIFSPVTKFLFYLPGCTLPTIFLSLAGGYPVGARGVKSLFDNKEINCEQLNRMMCFCVNAGPGFTLNFLAGALLRNPFIGMLMFTAQIVLSMLTGILCSFEARIHKKPFYFKKETLKNDNLKISEAVIESSEESSKSMISMCALVVIFSVVISIFENLNVLNFISDNLIRLCVPKSESLTLLTSFLEITSGCAKAVDLKSLPAIIAVAVGFGGMCVHFQVISILKNTRFNYLKFFVFRIFNAAALGFLTHVAINIFEKTKPAFSTICHPVSISNASTTHGSAALILLCIYFLFTVSVKSTKTSKNSSKNERSPIKPVSIH